MIFIPYDFDEVNVKIYASHKCHSFYLSHTTLADIDLYALDKNNRLEIR